MNIKSNLIKDCSLLINQFGSSSISLPKEMGMYKFWIFIWMVILGGGVATPQKIYSTNVESRADVKVYVEKMESRSDLVVYKTKVPSRAEKEDNKGIWFFEEVESRSDKTIFFKDVESRADLKIYFTDVESRAGWRNPSKKYLIY